MPLRPLDFPAFRTLGTAAKPHVSAVEPSAAPPPPDYYPLLSHPLPAYTDGLPTAPSLPDPPPLREHSTATLIRPSTSVFIGEPSPDDVAQGQIADCYVAAAMASVAAVRPDLIRRAVREMAPGDYYVSLYRPGERRPSPVRVDGDLYGRGTRPLYARGTHGELWPSLIEKAISIRAGGSYDAIGSGGRASRIMSALTGFDPVLRETQSFATAEVFFAFVRDQLEAHLPVALGTASEEARYEGTGLHGWHAYSVIGYTVRDGVSYLQIRNPWGRSEPGDDGQDDGIFLMPAAEAMSLFSSVHSVSR